MSSTAGVIIDGENLIILSRVRIQQHLIQQYESLRNQFRGQLKLTTGRKTPPLTCKRAAPPEEIWCDRAV